MNKLIFRAFIIGLPFLLFSADSDETLKFTRSSWNIAIERFSGELSEDNEYLSSSIPDLIRRELLSADMHILSGREISSYQKFVVDQRKADIIENLSREYMLKDNILFDSESTLESLSLIEEKIRSYKRQYDELYSIDSAEINTSDMLPVSWIGDSGDELLLENEIYTAPVISRLYDLDFLISGLIREIDGYIYLEISGFNQVTSEDVLIYSNTGSIDDIEIMSMDAADDLRSIILGRAWAKLKVVTNQVDSLIYSDGVLIGIGSADVNTIEPGTVFLEAIGEDNSYWSEEVELIALEQNEISGTLSQSDLNFMTLETDPAGADVYIGARWAGKTPLNIPRYKDKNIWVSIRNEGYYNRSFEISSDSPDDLFYELEEEELSRMDNFDLKKRDFYRSLGRFSLSVAAPVIMGGVYNNYAERYNGYASEYIATSDPDDYDLALEMERNYYISYGVFWGTVAISSGLLVDVFVKLSRYIKAAEALVE